VRELKESMKNMQTKIDVTDALQKIVDTEYGGVALVLPPAHEYALNLYVRYQIVDIISGKKFKEETKNIKIR